MIYNMELPDLSGLEPDDEIELLGQTHTPVSTGLAARQCFNCSLDAYCPMSEIFFCSALPDEYIFKLK